MWPGKDEVKMAYFDGIQVGDSVYRLNSSEKVRVIAVNDDFFGCDDRWEYNIQGEIRHSEELGQVVFWRPVFIDLPPRPKRKVKKVLDCWVNLYPGGLATNWPKKETADNHGSKHRLGEAVHIIHEYEEEELIFDPIEKEEVSP